MGLELGDPGLTGAEKPGTPLCLRLLISEKGKRLAGLMQALSKFTVKDLICSLPSEGDKFHSQVTESGQGPSF